MAEPVRARGLSDEEGRRQQQIVRRGKHRSIRVRRAMIIMASSSGTRCRRSPGCSPLMRTLCPVWFTRSMRRA
jgi:hypothetical protein